jgi:hypothetical protein
MIGRISNSLNTGTPQGIESLSELYAADFNIPDTLFCHRHCPIAAMIHFTETFQAQDAIYQRAPAPRFHCHPFVCLNDLAPFLSLDGTWGIIRRI